MGRREEKREGGRWIRERKRHVKRGREGELT